MGCLIGMVVILIFWVSVTLADTVPEEAQRYMARGMAAVEMAKMSRAMVYTHFKAKSAKVIPQ
jgi:hypothetical protein